MIYPEYLHNKLMESFNDAKKIHPELHIVVYQSYKIYDIIYDQEYESPAEVIKIQNNNYFVDNISFDNSKDAIEYCIKNLFARI